MKKINLVTFDVKGTLLTFQRSIGEIYADAAKCFGFTVDPNVITDNFNKEISKMSKQHPNFGHSDLGWQEWWKRVVTKSFDCTMSENDASSNQPRNLDALSDYLIDRFATKHEWKLVKGSIDLIKYLECKGVHMGIISNFDPRLHKILVDMDVRKYFTFVITSYETGYLKPDENIFKEAEKTFTIMGHEFDKSSTVHVGDSLKYDYYGAKKAGWEAVLINQFLEKINNGGNTLVFKDLIEFKDKFLKQ